MGDNTPVAVTQVNSSDTGKLHVPAHVQREQDICIDDVVEVTLFDVNDYVDSASFENPQVSGDFVTVPADFVRSVGLELGEAYPVSFEKVEEVDTEAEEQSDAENLLEQMGAEVSGEEADAEEEEEEETLGELFG